VTFFDSISNVAYAILAVGFLAFAVISFIEYKRSKSE